MLFLPLFLSFCIFTEYFHQNAYSQEPCPNGRILNLLGPCGDYQKNDLFGVNLVGKDLTGIQVLKHNMDSSKLDASNFTQAILDKSSIKNATLRGTIFKGASLLSVNFTQSKLEFSNFENAKLVSTSFQDSELAGVIFSKANLESANLCARSIDRATFTGATYNEKTQIPLDSPESIGMIYMGDPALKPKTSTCCKSGEAGSLACAAQIVKANGYLNKNQIEKINVYQWKYLIPARAIISEKGSSKTVFLSNPSWLFFVDLHPGSLFDHPVQYLLVDQKTGTLKILDRSSAPVFQGMTPFLHPDDFNESQYKISEFTYHKTQEALGSRFRVNNFNPTLPTLPSPTDSDIDYTKYPKRSGELDSDYKKRVKGYYQGFQDEIQAKKEINGCTCLSKPSKKYALVINGGNLPRNNTDSLALAYSKNGFETLFLSPESASDPAFPSQGHNSAVTSLDNVKKAFQFLASNVTNCCDEVEIVFYAHGTPLAQMDLNSSYVRPIPNGAQSPGKQPTGNLGGGFLSTQTLKTYLDTIRSCQVKFFLLSCYSGSHFKNGLNNISDQDKRGCLCRTVVTTSSELQVSWESAEIFLKKRTQGSSFTDSYFALIDEYKKTKSNRPDPGAASPIVQSTQCILCEDPDKDGISTGEELKDGYSDPTKADTDGDGWNDGKEKEAGTNPRNKDTDGDGVSDSKELPDSSPLSPDTDDDGLNDLRERQAGTKPNDPDTDKDGLTDGAEFNVHRTNPLNSDTDGDGVKDGDEIAKGTDPNDPESK